MVVRCLLGLRIGRRQGTSVVGARTTLHVRELAVQGSSCTAEPLAGSVLASVETLVPTSPSRGNRALQRAHPHERFWEEVEVVV